MHFPRITHLFEKTIQRYDVAVAVKIIYQGERIFTLMQKKNFSRLYIFLCISQHLFLSPFHKLEQQKYSGIYSISYLLFSISLSHFYLHLLNMYISVRKHVCEPRRSKTARVTMANYLFINKFVSGKVLNYEYAVGNLI